MDKNIKTFPCRVCEKPVSKETRLCGACGFQHAKGFQLKYAIILLLVFLFFGFIIYSSIGSEDILVFHEPVHNLPPDEKKFIKVLTDYAEGYQKIQNDDALGVYTDSITLRAQRRQELYLLNLNPNISGWLGTVGAVQKTKEGNLSLSIQLTPQITIETSKNELRDTETNTLITKDSPLFTMVNSLKAGEPVVINGNFFFSSEDIFEERSTTIHTSILNPTFLFKFRSIQRR